MEDQDRGAVMNILVTGGTGFIGEYFIPLLLQKGHKVRLLIRNLEKARRLFGDRCEYFVGDITKAQSLTGCCENISIVFHMVAKVGNQLPSKENFEVFRKINVEGTKYLIEESKKSFVEKFIFVSSIAAMGIVKHTPITENSKCTPFLPYQISKYEAEQLVRQEYEKNGFPGICVRPTKVYGIGEHEYSYLTLSKICRRGIFLKVGRGMNYTSNIYITDFVNGLYQLVRHGKYGETYILSSNESISFMNVGKIIAKALDKKVLVITVPKTLMIAMTNIEEKVFWAMRKTPIVTKKNIEATVCDRIYDISKAKKELGFAPKVSIKTGIIRTVEWYKHQGLV